MGRAGPVRGRVPFLLLFDFDVDVDFDFKLNDYNHMIFIDLTPHT
jgi:hypothetical protein